LKLETIMLQKESRLPRRDADVIWFCLL
jgi:hypothetical protein